MRSEKLIFSSLYLGTALLTFAVFGTVFAPSANAQSSSNILVNITPENPAPYEDVSINLNSYANNLDSVLITWSVDGKNVLSDIGKKSFFIKAPAAGSQNTVVATVSLPDGNQEVRVIIRPNVMVLLWQANDSYVPPFYRGKALPISDSEIKVVAMPEIRTSSGIVSSKNITYSWKKDYTNDQESSGYGKNFFLYTNDYLDGLSNISVVAETTNQQYSSEANITVGTSEPKILFYKEDNRLGTVWEAALGDSHRIQGSEIVEAIPYFISPKEIGNPILKWSWFINDGPVTISSFRKNIMPLKVDSGTSGTSKLRLDVENKYKISQTISKEISIEF